MARTDVRPAPVNQPFFGQHHLTIQLLPTWVLGITSGDIQTFWSSLEIYAIRLRRFSCISAQKSVSSFHHYFSDSGPWRRGFYQTSVLFWQHISFMARSPMSAKHASSLRYMARELHCSMHTPQYQGGGHCRDRDMSKARNHSLEAEP